MLADVPNPVELASPVPALMAGLCLVGLGAALFAFHRQGWRKCLADPAVPPEDRQYYRKQFVRRVQVSWLLAFVGILLPLGDSILPRLWPPQEHPIWFAWYWILVIALVSWLILLAISDLTAAHAHTALAIARLRETQRKIEQELLSHRVRSNGTPGGSSPESNGSMK